MTDRRELHRKWDWWFDGAVRKGATKAEYEKAMKHLGTFGDILNFWRYWNNFDVQKFPLGSNLRLFEKSVKPTWEDPVNMYGGKWMVNVPKEGSVVTFLELLLSTIGEDFQFSEWICGVVYAIRGRSDVISLWHRSRTPEDAKVALRAQFGKYFDKDAKINYAMHVEDAPPPLPSTPPLLPKSTSMSSSVVGASHRRSISYSGPSRRFRKRSVDWTVTVDTPTSQGTFQERLAAKQGKKQGSQNLEIFTDDSDDDDLQIPAYRQTRLSDTKSRFKWQRFYEREEQQPRRRRARPSADHGQTTAIIKEEREEATTTIKITTTNTNLMIVLAISVTLLATVLILVFVQK